jgi:hypothetical protein
MLTDSEILRRDQIGPGFRVVPLENWRAHVRTRSNLLVTGPAAALSPFVQAARSEMREPIASVAGSAPLFLGAHTSIVTGSVLPSEHDSFESSGCLTVDAAQPVADMMNGEWGSAW